MFFWAASFEKRACWNTSLSGYVRVEMWTVSPDDRRRDMSSKAAVVFPVPVSPFTRRSRVFRSSNFCNSGGKGISGDAPRSSFNIRSPNWREVGKLGGDISPPRAPMCSSVFTERNPGHLAECWRPERRKSSQICEILRCEAPWHTPDRPFGAPSDRQRPPLLLHLQRREGRPRACTLCVRCHRSTRGALQGTRDGTRVRVHRFPSGANIIRQSAIGGSPGTPYHPAIKKRNV